MALPDQFGSKQVLTRTEALACLGESYSPNERTRESLLAYHVRKGRLIRVRRGLYAVVPQGADPETHAIDPYLIAGKLADDAVLAYHTALEFHGKAHSAFERFYIQSQRTIRPTIFRSHRFECVPFPKSLRKLEKEHFATKTQERLGVNIRVASLERTLVDLLDRPKLGGGWEEIWRSLESVEFFDVEMVIAYTMLLDNATTTAKVGYYLESHAEALMIKASQLQTLRDGRPEKPHYLERGKSGRLISEWNLVVPIALVERTWEEVL